MITNKNFYINDLKVLIPDLNNTLKTYLYSKDDNDNKKAKFTNIYPNQTELWNLRVLKSQLVESIEYTDNLINEYNNKKYDTL